MERQQYIGNLEKYKGMSLRGIARETGHHFKTVKKYVDKEDWNVEYKRRKKRESKLDPLKGIIDEWIREDMGRQRKNRRTAVKIYADLAKSEEYSKQLSIGRQSVLNYVNRRKKEMRKEVYQTAMFAQHTMCEAQVDFGEFIVKQRNGSEEKWKYLVVSLPWSNAGFAQVCRYETKECLCEALQKIFEYMGGVPLRILFDNMSSAVVHIEEHGKRKVTEMFMRFTMHHRFKAEFCNPESPQEKGNVENKVGYLRRNYLLPPREINDLAAFNAELLENCREDMKREHYVKGEQISDLYAAEQEGMIPLPRERFRVFTLEKVKTDKYSFIHYEKNRYSTSAEYAECEMWLEIGTNELRILNGRYEHVATHERKYEREELPSIDFRNYLTALSQKPRAFLSSPYMQTLPEAVQKYLRECTYAELKKMLLVLVPIIKEGKIGDAAAVLELAPIKNTDEFSVAYRALTEDTRSQPTVTTAQTPHQQPYLPKLDSYSALMGGEG